MIRLRRDSRSVSTYDGSAATTWSAVSWGILVSTGGSATNRQRSPSLRVHFAATLALVFLRALDAALLNSSVRSSAFALLSTDSSPSALHDSRNGSSAR